MCAKISPNSNFDYMYAKTDVDIVDTPPHQIQIEIYVFKNQRYPARKHLNLVNLWK